MTQPDAAPDRTVPATGTPHPATSDGDLAARFWERIRLFAARRLGGSEGADDVAQETIRRVTEALHSGRLRQPEALPGFVFRTAQHICQQQHRSADREVRGLSRLAVAEADAESPDPLAGLIAGERRLTVHRALLQLSADDREILRLLYFQEMEPETIARQWNLTPGALRVRKHRALKRLSELLDDRDT